MMDGEHIGSRLPQPVLGTAGSAGLQASGHQPSPALDTALPRCLLAVMESEFSADGVATLFTAILAGCHNLLPTAVFGVTLRGDAGHRAGSDDQATAMIELEESLEEGPSIDAMRGGVHIVNVSDAERRRRWPVVDPLLRVAGFTAVHAVPLRHRESIAGAVTVYQRSADVVSAEVVHHLTALAGAAALSLERVRLLDQMQRRNAQLEQALSSRVVIEQAKGVLATRLGISVDEAFTVIRGHARHQQSRLRTVAEAIVSGSLVIQELKRSA